MRKSHILVVLPAIALSGCALMGGRSNQTGELGVRRSGPLVIPSSFTLPPPGQPAPRAR